MMKKMKFPWFQRSSHPWPETTGSGNEVDDEKDVRKKHGGWRVMPYILGNETFERLASFGLLANFMVYLRREYHLNQVTAINVINIWGGVTSFTPLIGAFISDAYAGRFLTIAFASLAALLGMMTMTLTAWLPELHPPPCIQTATNQCAGPSTFQLGFLLLGIGFLSIGAGGIRPCSIPFGVDQFDATSEEGRKGINSFFNWYYATFTVVLILSSTVVVYVQDSFSWTLGFGILTALMFGSIIVFFVGAGVYTYVKPQGSVFSGVAQVIIAAYKKRRVDISSDKEVGGRRFYDPPLEKGSNVLTKLSLTNQFRFLNKGAVISEGDLNQDGSRIDKWRICSVQQVEELKCVIRIIPILASGIISLTSMTQQGTLTVSQALQMDRHLGPSFQIPPGSIGVISFITVGLWIPFYDRIVVPFLRKITKHEGGITLLQRIGIGLVFSILSMVVAGAVETQRRDLAISSKVAPFAASPMSILWLAPQLVLLGFCEAFNIIGQIELYNKEVPEHMRSMGNSLFSCSFGLSSYVNALIVSVVHRTTRSGRGRADWLTDDINAGRLDYFYYLLAFMGGLNLLYFLYCSKKYRYKGGKEMDEEGVSFDLESSSTSTSTKV